MTENRAITDYNTIKENLEMERIQHEIEIKALEEKLEEAKEVINVLLRISENSHYDDCASEGMDDPDYPCDCGSFEKNEMARSFLAKHEKKGRV